MDIEVMSRQIADLVKFKSEVEAIIRSTEGQRGQASEHIEDLLRFKDVITATLPVIQKTFGDVAILSADIEAIRQDLAPVIAWVEKQQAAEAAAEKAKAEAPKESPKEAGPEQQAAPTGEARQPDQPTGA
ncbi:hypothetical protein H8A95_15970 [Bradyrhizobium sp. Pear76]|uniref:hypothetical protein n=1 Tax=Bradyrhizobium oropedii TaxID=1571201 RepID=UPI001E5EB311|nr:hypothetical protein [Bradyrhizobium oropedii]MCC8963768.1 hypothetical protein [Bradyrhizobium oropedii]